MGILDRFSEAFNVLTDRGNINGNLSNIMEVDKNDSPSNNSIKVARINEYDFPNIESGQYIDYGALSKFRDMSNDRVSQYRAYDDMTKDIIISSALEMYADDASQYDTEGRLIWCDSGNPELDEFVNELLDTLELGRNLWSIYYALALYGDVYLRLNKRKTKPSEISSEESLFLEDTLESDVDYEDYIEICDNPESIFDLTLKGKTSQYALVNTVKGPNGQTKERIELYPPDEFVHILIKRPSTRDKQEFSFETLEDDVKRLHTYKVRRGKSMLHDIYGIQREIELLENTVILNRVSKSAITRIVSVEVGDMSKQDTATLLRRVKSSLESKMVINKDGMSSMNSPGQVDNIVVSPVRNGKGSISSQNIGGDVDVKSLLDLDYFNDKRFGGLKIPKAFLGFDEALGSNAGGTLTKMDARYGRTIKRLQTCVVEGVTDLVNLYLLRRGHSNWIGDYKIRVVSPTTVEDLDRDELAQTRISMITSIADLVGEIGSVDDKRTVLTHLVNNYMDDPELSAIIGKTKQVSGEEEI